MRIQVTKSNGLTLGRRGLPPYKIPARYMPRLCIVDGLQFDGSRLRASRGAETEMDGETLFLPACPETRQQKPTNVPNKSFFPIFLERVVAKSTQAADVNEQPSYLSMWILPSIEPRVQKTSSVWGKFVLEMQNKLNGEKHQLAGAAQPPRRRSTRCRVLSFWTL